MTASVRGAFASTLKWLREGPIVFARRNGLALRVVVAVAASLVFLLVASEVFFTRAASSALIEQDARSYVADANALEIAYQEGSDPADAIDDVLDLVDSMEDRLGIDSATLLDSDGDVVAAARDANLGSDRGAKSGRACRTELRRRQDERGRAGLPVRRSDPLGWKAVPAAGRTQTGSCFTRASRH